MHRKKESGLEFIFKIYKYLIIIVLKLLLMIYY